MIAIMEPGQSYWQQMKLQTSVGQYVTTCSIGVFFISKIYGVEHRAILGGGNYYGTRKTDYST